jgi:hypothetical protein
MDCLNGMMQDKQSLNQFHGVIFMVSLHDMQPLLVNVCMWLKLPPRFSNIDYNVFFNNFQVETSTGLVTPACFDRTSRCPDEIVRRIRVTVHPMRTPV